jgi:hypothetical protein
MAWQDIQLRNATRGTEIADGPGAGFKPKITLLARFIDHAGKLTPT